MTATRAYSKNDYIAIDTKLYQVTANSIAIGATLSVGTNIKEIKLAESVNASAAQIAENAGDIADLKEQSLRQLTSAEVSALTSLYAMPKGVYFSANNTKIIELDNYFSDKDLPNDTTFIVVSYRYGSVTNTGIIEIFNASWNVHYIGYVISSNDNVVWNKINYNERLNNLDTKITDIDGYVSRFFPVTDYSADNKFSITDMPNNSHTYSYAYRFNEKPYDINENDILAIFINPISATENVRLIRLYDFTENLVYVGRFIPEKNIIWIKNATFSDIDELSNNIDELSNNIDELSNDNAKNIVPKNSYNLHASLYGIEFTGNGKTGFNVDGTAIGSQSNPDQSSFLNIISTNNAVVRPGDTIYIYSENLSIDTVYLRLYLYPNTLPNRNIVIDGNTSIYIPEGCTGILARLEVKAGTTLSDYSIDIEITNGMRPTDVSEQFNSEGIKMLCFGSSFTYSTLSYLPQLMKEITPKTHFVIGICYNSGETLAGHLSKWNNNTPYTTYCEYDSRFGKWTKLSNSITGKQTTARYKWDFITLQQASRHTNDYNSLELFANAIIDYIDYPVSFIYNLIQALNADATFPDKYGQPTGREKSDAMFNDMADYAERAINDCIVSYVIPGGTAVQNARTTTLDEIATNGGDLANDLLGHLQNGLPVLIPAYAAAYKLCEINNIKPKMFASQYNPTDTELAEIDTPSIGHGSCVGVTDTNKIIAQKCALMAIKHPFEISDMSAY